MTDEMRRASLRRRAGVHATAFALAVMLDAVAFATVLRPRHGYTSTNRLLIVLAVGVGVALVALIVAGAAAAHARRRHKSLLAATTALPTLSFVLALFITAAVGSQIIGDVRPPGGAHASPGARRDFQRWQATVVPIVVRWMDTIRTDRALVHGVPTSAGGGLRRQVDRSERTLAGLVRSLVAASPGLPQRLQLRQLTSQLETALAVARRAQRTYALALAAAAAAHGGVGHKARASRVRSLIDRGNAAAQRSVAIMAAFSVGANELGGSLFVEKP